MAPPEPWSVVVNLDILWAKRGGRAAAMESLAAYAVWCIKGRSTGTPGGQRISAMEAADVVNNALLNALKEAPAPSDGEQFYLLVRRKIDNGLRTIEKSPKTIPMVPLVTGVAPAGTVSFDTVADEQAADPAANLVADEEEAHNRRIVEETKKRLRSPQCMEALLLEHIVAGNGDKQRICELLKIDGAKFDRLKFTLKQIATAVRADLERKTRR